MTKVFKIPTSVDYTTHITPQGTTVVFYKGYAIADNAEVADYCSRIPECKDVTALHKDLNTVPTPPNRTRARGQSWAAAESTVITPSELLMKAAAVTSSAQVPQAAQSISTK